MYVFPDGPDNAKGSEMVMNAAGMSELLRVVKWLRSLIWPPWCRETPVLPVVSYCFQNISDCRISS